MIKIHEWSIYPDTCTLVRRGAESVKVGDATPADGSDAKRISPRNMDVLVYLVERQGEVVSAEELLDAFWVSSTTTDHAVHKIVASLRAALGDSAAEPRFIKTLPKRGYCLIAPVERSPGNDTRADHADTPPVSPSSASTSGVDPARQHTAPGSLAQISRLRGAVAMVTCMLVLLVGVLMYEYFARDQVDALVSADLLEPPPSNEVVRLAVIEPGSQTDLPVTLGQQLDVLMNSMAVSLSRLQGLDVIAPSRGMVDIDAARLTGASHALVSNVHGSGDSMRLVISLVRTDDDVSLYANQFSLQESDLPVIEQELIPIVVESLSIHLNPERYEEMLAWGTSNARAYRYFLRAGFYNDQYNHQDWEQALYYYDRAIHEDPGFVNAYLGKATAANNSAVYSRQARVQQLSDELLELSRNLAVQVPGSSALETLHSLRLRMEGHNEWHKEQKYREIIRLGNAPGYVYSNYALLLMGARLYEEANRYLELAQNTPSHQITPNQAWNFATQTLSPQELATVKVQQLLERPVHIGILGTAISSLVFVGDNERAHTYLRRQIERDGDGVRAHLSQIIMEFAGEVENPASYRDDLLRAGTLTDPDLAFNNGIMHLIQGDISGAAQYWKHLTPIDSRKLFTRLHALEIHFPDAVIHDAAYAELLEKVGVGVTWQRNLMEGVQALSEYTGITLSPASQEHYQRGELMLHNNLWGLHN